MNLERIIKRILKEEFKKDKIIDGYITSLIKPVGNFKDGYKYDAGRFDITDNDDHLRGSIFYR